jgi:hypothetical protein
VRSVWVFILCSLAASAAWSQTPARAPLDAIRECEASAEEDALGLDDLDTECPGLRAALDEIGASDWLSRTQRDELSPHGLADFVQLTERYRVPPGAHRPDPADLAPILDSLDEARDQQPRGLLDRLKGWMRSLLERQADSGSWLAEWLEDFELSGGVTLAIVYGLAALVVISALGIVFNELRVARAFGGKSSRRLTHVAAALAGGRAAAPTLADIESAPMHERPSLLLRLVVASLIGTGRLTVERSLTHRELVARARLDDASQRDNLARLASTAEQIMYSGSAPAAGDVDRAIEAGHALKLQLDGAP